MRYGECQSFGRIHDVQGIDRTCNYRNTPKGEERLSEFQILRQQREALVQKLADGMEEKNQGVRKHEGNAQQLSTLDDYQNQASCEY